MFEVCICAYIGPLLTSGIILIVSPTLLIEAEPLKQTQSSECAGASLASQRAPGCPVSPPSEVRSINRSPCGFLGLELLSSHLQDKRYLLSHLPNPVSFFLSFQTAAPLFTFFSMKNFQNMNFCDLDLLLRTNLFEGEWYVSYHHIGYKHPAVKLLAYGIFKNQWWTGADLQIVIWLIFLKLPWATPKSSLIHEYQWSCTLNQGSLVQGSQPS